MCANWIYVRDQIVIDPTLKQRLDLTYPVGTTLVLAARSITHAPNYHLQLPGSTVIVLATEYRGNAGSIDVSGTAGPRGTTGRDGASGATGGTIALFCEHAYGVHLVSNGGLGGVGGAGVPGRTGLSERGRSTAGGADVILRHR